MDDDITNALMNLDGKPPEAQNLTESEKDLLIQSLGPKTTLNIIKAKKDFPLSRIPFLFSSLDTQKVVNVLHNDLSEAIKRANTGD